MEVYGEKPKKFTKEWWSYIWLYYKWHFIGVAAVIFMVVTFLHECATRPSYDLQIALVTEPEVVMSQTDKMQSYAEGIVNDATGNGKNEVYILPICLSDESDPQSIQVGYARFTAEIAMPESYVFIMSREYADTVIKNGILERTEAWAPGVESDGYVVSLKDNEKLKEFGIDSSANELYMGVVSLFEDNRENELEAARHENGVKLARSLLGLE